MKDWFIVHNDYRESCQAWFQKAQGGEDLPLPIRDFQVAECFNVFVGIVPPGAKEDARSFPGRSIADRREPSRQQRSDREVLLSLFLGAQGDMCSVCLPLLF